MGVGQARQVALVDDRGGEARLGKDHDAGGRLQEVRAGAAADHEEERVLYLAVQPDDAGQPAEHFALAAFAQHRRIEAAARCGRRLQSGGHQACLSPCAVWCQGSCAASRAARSFSRNCAALTT